MSEYRLNVHMVVIVHADSADAAIAFVEESAGAPIDNDMTIDEIISVTEGND